MTESNSKALALMQTNDIEMVKQKAAIYIASGFLPEAIKTPEQALAIIFYGRELNVPDWTALKHISVVHGNPQPDGQLTIALIQRSGLLEKYKIVRSDAQVCTLLVKRRGYDEMEFTCTFDEAGQLKTSEKRNGTNTTISLTEKYNWKQQPKTMLFYFTNKQMGHRLFNDVLNGMAGTKQGDLTMPDLVENTTFYDDELSELGAVEPPPIPLSLSPSGASATTPESAASAEDVQDGEFTETETGTTSPPAVPAWTDDANRWLAFLKRANDRFSFGAKTVTETLDAFDGLGFGDWRQDQGWALAALIAEFCQTQRRIDEYTSSMAGVKEEVALQLCEYARQIATAKLNAEFEQI